MRRNSEYSSPFIALVVGTLIFFCWVLFVLFMFLKPQANLGEEAVMLMYDFADPHELADNMIKLEEICDEEVFKQLTIDNEERTLQTYLKFKGEPVSVIILDKSDDYILYSLRTKYISQDRKFTFYYKVNRGKICEVREMECVDFQ